MKRPAPPENVAESAVAACRRLLGISRAVAQPRSALPNGLRPRRAVQRTTLLDTEAGGVVAIQRGNPRKTATEAAVLSVLYAGGAPVPKLLASDASWLMVETIAGQTLAQALADVAVHRAEALLDTAFGALARCRAVATASGLGERLPRLPPPNVPLRAVARMGRQLGLPPLTLSQDLLQRLAPSAHAGVIKVDTRPANALVQPNGSIVWIDWEHAGIGHPMIDTAWLLGDEWTPGDADSEARLLARHGPGTTEWGDVPESDFRLYGSINMLARLSAILKAKGQGPWWPADACLEHDLFGVTQICASRLAHRAVRWAGAIDNGAKLADWAGQVVIALETRHP